MSDNTPEMPKPNWPMIAVGAVVALGALTTAVVVLLMWVYNFNILDWIE